MNKYRVPEIQKIGVYAIHNKKNGKYYIGSSINVYNRMLCHARRMKNRKIGVNQVMTRDLLIDGYKSYDFEVLETFADGTITDKELRDIEQKYINQYAPQKTGYNRNYCWETKKFEDGELLACHPKV